MPKKEAPEARLEDLDVREVSLVDKPANRRRFLVIKRQEESMSTKRRAAPADEVRKDDAGQADDNNAVTKDEDGGFFDILGIGDQGDADASAAADDAGEGGGEGDPEPVEKAKAKDMLGKLTPILKKLTSATEKAKGLGDKPITPEIVKTVGEVVEALKALGGKADEGEGEGGDDADKDKKEKADVGALASAVSKLTAIVESVKKAGDGDAPEVTSKLASIAKGLEGYLAKQKQAGEKKDEKADDKKADDKKDAKGKTEKALELFKAVAGDDDPDPMVVIKAGAKMQRSRLSKLKKAVETLAALIQELEGDAGGKEKATKSEVDLSPVLSRIDDFASAVKERFEALEGSVDTVNKRVESIENTRPAGNGEGDPEPVQKSDEGNFWAGVL